MSDWASTQPISAEVKFGSGGSLKGDIHLQPIRGGHEAPLDMLNRPDAFYAVTLPDGGTRLVSKAQTAAVSIAADVQPLGHEPHYQPVRFEVRMADGSDLTGDAPIELRPSSRRGMDLLNEPTRFFALTAGNRTWLLNRSHVRYVRPHD